jgi:hypothetical protein
MSDYLLNKVYDSLLVNKPSKTKSTFRTLSESYNLVYEEETKNIEQTQDQLTQKPIQPIQTAPEEAQKKEIQFDVTKNILNEINWKPYQRKFYNINTVTGIGPGELSVASLLTGSDKEEDNMSLISGQSLSFDVSWPKAPDTQSTQKPQYTFEVKQLEAAGDVRIGIKGAEIGRIVIENIKYILNTIKEEYDLLSLEDQETLSAAILKYVKEPEKPTFKHFTRQNEPTAKEKKKLIPYEKKLARRTDWRLGGFIDAIISSTSELPFNMLFGDDYTYQGSEKKSPLRAKYVLLSVKQLLDALNKSAENIKQDAQTTSNKTDELKTTFKHFYSEPESQKKEVIDQFLDKEAENVDRKITRFKTKETGQKLNIDNLLAAIKETDLFGVFMNVYNKVKDPETIRSLFPVKPEPITGLFVVSSNGYRYVISQDIGKYIEISTFTQGKPKIKFKGEQVVEI